MTSDPFLDVFECLNLDGASWQRPWEMHDTETRKAAGEEQVPQASINTSLNRSSHVQSSRLGLKLLPRLKSEEP